MRWRMPSSEASPLTAESVAQPRRPDRWARQHGHAARWRRICPAGVTQPCCPGRPRCAEIPVRGVGAGRPTRHGCLVHQGFGTRCGPTNSLRWAGSDVKQNSRQMHDPGDQRPEVHARPCPNDTSRSCRSTLRSGYPGRRCSQAFSPSGRVSELPCPRFTRNNP
jgi:hypothetical protein